MLCPTSRKPKPTVPMKPRRFQSGVFRYGLGLGLLLTLGSPRAFEVFPFASGAETLYLKWGDNHAGTPATVIYWSLIPPGTVGNVGYCGDACPGLSLASLQLENAPGTGFSARTLLELEPQIRFALAQWSALTGIRFVKLDNDSGVAINDPAALPNATGQIRIGIFAFSSGGGAVGFAPPPNGGSGAGDLLFDANSFYQLAPGAEGAPFSTTFAPNDLLTLLVHELGHVIGLAHPAFDGSCPVMQVHASCLGLINRIPDADDIAGARFLYGHLFADGLE